MAHLIPCGSTQDVCFLHNYITQISFKRPSNFLGYMCLPNSSGEKWLRKEAVSRMSKPCLEFGISFQLHPADEEHAVASSAKCCASTTLGELRWDSGGEGEFSPATLVRGDVRLLSEVTVAVLEVAVVARCCQHMSCYISSLLNYVTNIHFSLKKIKVHRVTFISEMITVEL